MFLGNHTTWAWTEQETADWELAQDAIRMVWVAAATREEEAISQDELNALSRLERRMEEEYNLLERTDRDVVHRVIGEYPKLAAKVKRGEILEVSA